MVGGVIYLELVPVVAGALAVSIAAVHALLRNRQEGWLQTIDAWQRAADLLGLELKVGRMGTLQMEGDHGQLRFTIETALDRATGGPITRFQATMNAAHELRIEPLPVFTHPGIHRRVECGDPELDDYYFFSGPEAEVLALLDPEARDVVRRMMTRQTIISGGQIISEEPGYIAQPQSLIEKVRRLVRLAGVLAIAAEQIADRLLKNAKIETDDCVRRHFFAALLRPNSGLPTADTAAKIGLLDPDPFIRMLSGLHLGAAHYDLVERIARAEPLPHESRLFAFGHLAARAPSNWGAGFVERVIRVDGRSAQRAVLRSMVAARRRDLCDALIAAAENQSLPDETKFELAEALGRLGGPTAEPVLLGVLKSCGLPAVRISGIEALARVGSVRSVEPLHEIARNVFMEHGYVREAAKRAIRRIQSRLLDAQAGQLSIAVDDHRGDLSVPASEEGALSLKGTRG